MRTGVAAGAAAMVLATVAAGGAQAADQRVDAHPSAAPVVAVVAEKGLNALHRDFRVTGQERLPEGARHAVQVAMPRGRSFEDRLKALQDGPLGRLAPGELHRLAGTRLLFVNVGSSPRSAVGDALSSGRVTVSLSAPDDVQGLGHGTGVASSVVGTRFGTAPTAYAVVVVGPIDAAYDWLADNRWVDVSTMSGHSPLEAPCYGVAPVRRFHATGRIPFAAIGNADTLQAGLLPPTALPEVYRVGGVDGSGRPWAPTTADDVEPSSKINGTARGYDTGELFHFRAADFASDDKYRTFGGTSGATPRTAGRALTLIQRARELLGTRTPAAATYASRGSRRGPTSGPLSDGELTRDELVAVLHATARPAEPPSPTRFSLEGYGAISDDSTRTAMQVLAGELPLPERVGDDEEWDRSQDARRTMFANCP